MMEAPKEPNGRASGCFISTIENKFLLICGSDREKAYDEIWELDTIAKTWKLITNEVLKNIITPRSGCGYAITKKTNDILELYLSGGQNYFLHQFFGDMIRMEINLTNNTNQITIENLTKYPLDINTMPCERNSHCVCYDNKGDRLFIFGGGTKEELLNDLWSFDCKTKQFNKCFFENEALLSPRELCGMVYDEVNNALLIFGGRLYESIDNSLFIIPLVDNSQVNKMTIEKGQNMPIALCSFAYVKYSHYIIIYGGTDANNFFNIFIVYNIQSKIYKKSKVIINKDLINYDPNLSVFLGRISAMMTIDAKEEHLVLFGGSASDKEWNFVNVIQLNELLNEDNLIEIKHQ